MKEIGIYIHIPFCKSKCYYCDFASFANKTDLINKYVDAIIKEIESAKSNKYNVNTIYIGGGTPSFINAEYIEDILKSIFKNFNIDNNVEVTIEVNPGTVNIQKLECYKKAGINRLSIGLQTTNDILLQKIGRIHSYKDFINTYNFAKECDFSNINVDLMLGLPRQTIKDLKDSLNKVINLGVQHISIYSLIVEDETILKTMLDEHKLELPKEETERQMYWTAKKILESKGYKHYEISNFAKNGYESRHNVNCWEQKEYLGFGSAAHSYIDNIRFCNIDLINEYIQNIQNNNMNKNKVVCEVQTNEDKQKEYMLLGLRKIDGVSIRDFKNRFVTNPLFLYHNEIRKLVSENLLQVDGDNIKLTCKGLDLANLVWEEFV